MRKAFYASLLLSFLFTNVHAQVGIGTNTPDPAAMLEVSSTNKGMLIPRVALTDINDVTTIPSAPQSLIVYNTATAGSGVTAVIPGYYYWNGMAWLNIVTYTLQQNINTNGKFLSGDGTNTGIFLTANGGMVATGEYGAGPDLVENSTASKIIWNPKKGALMVGGSSTDVPWTAASIGDYSAVFGNGTIATGSHSFSSGFESAAIGSYSVSMGLWNTTYGSASVALGSGNTAGGNSSLALGTVSVANGEGAVAIGKFAGASGDYSTALGNAVETNLNEGAFIIGDNSSGSVVRSSHMPNEMSMHFANGYRLATSTMAFKISGGGTIVSNGVFGSGDVLTATGTGARMIWYPNKAAFRAGLAESALWNDANVGNYSVALGRGTEASGLTSTAFGYGTRAEGPLSTAMGSSTTAAGQSSTAMGSMTTAVGDFATAMGYVTQANGEYATAMGFFTFASNTAALATGTNTKAEASSSTAMGNNVTTNVLHTGSFIIGDASSPPTNTESSKADEMTMRFANGYRLFSDADATIGVKVDPGSNAWSTISDVHLKENFEPIDGDEFLRRIGSIPVSTTWNYKGQDPKQYRHYGPMAQDFYKAFGRDGYGVIGNDTAINQADFDGVNFTAIQALVTRTDKLQKENDQQLQKIGKLEKEVESLKEMLLEMRAEKKR